MAADWHLASRWPLTSGSIALAASAQSIGLDGTLVADVLGEGPLRVQGTGRWHDQTLEIESLHAWWPRSAGSLRAAGTVRFVQPAPDLALRAEWTALRWPLAGAPGVESALGTLTVNGALPYVFSVQAHAQVAGLPAAEFTAAGAIDGEQLVLDRFDGQAFGGRLAGSGRVAWGGEQPWSARLAARNLDIATLRPDLPGRISRRAAPLYQ